MCFRVEGNQARFLDTEILARHRGRGCTIRSRHARCFEHSYAVYAVIEGRKYDTWKSVESSLLCTDIGLR